MAASLSRLPPAGSPIPAAELWALARGRDPERALREGLRALLGPLPVALCASGREALRLGLALLAKRSGREEVLVPAYTCYSVPAAVVAAGLRVRLVDVTPAGQVDREALRALPRERAAALVVTNLFGNPEPVDALRAELRADGVALVDDAAQALGARSPEGAPGTRGDLGLLSFGRGKPLSALGGGALVGTEEGALEPALPAPRRSGALARALAYDLALRPAVFRWLAAIPALHVGETRFDPAFRRGGIDGASLCLAAAALPRFAAETEARRERALALAARLEAETRFVPLRAAPDAAGVYPRLAVRAPSPAAREAALLALRDAGASVFYPASLDAVEPLRPFLAGDAPCPGARELAARLLTLPTHAGLRPARARRVASALRALA
jgi:dTDP-4-amino-4,6-dideoxygalactose transaminase